MRGPILNYDGSNPVKKVGPLRYVIATIFAIAALPVFFWIIAAVLSPLTNKIEDDKWNFVLFIADVIVALGISALIFRAITEKPESSDANTKDESNA